MDNINNNNMQNTDSTNCVNQIYKENENKEKNLVKNGNDDYSQKIKDKPINHKINIIPFVNVLEEKNEKDKIKGYLESNNQDNLNLKKKKGNNNCNCDIF